MKKFLPYILILVVIVGAYTLAINTFAQDAVGDCTINGQTQGGVTERECKIAEGVWSSGTSYQFLVPLGDTPTFDPTKDGGGDLGKYLNVMIKLFIGICAVLAVIMIVIGGLEYMTNELVSEKADGKNKIKGAIFGLVLALGAYTILYTINPELLDTSLSSLEDVTVEVALADAIPSDTGNPPGATSRCSSGVVKTQISMFACSDIVNNINNMLTAAKNAGINITGGGYRSVEQQTQLRIKNCKGNTTDSSAPCNPPTALPGESNHNHGKAFDLQCDGVFIQTRDNKCFTWLKENASKFGLYNLASEPWHWSVDGR